MQTKNIVWLVAFSAAFVGVFQIVALKFYLYWTVWWFDIVMHFMGGFWVALVILWFYKSFFDNRSRSDHAYLLALLGVILVGVAWEVFEVLAGLTKGQEHYLFDTVLDLIMDTIGAIVATYLVFKKSLGAIAENSHG